MDPRLSSWMSWVDATLSQADLPRAGLTLTPLTGDASTRSYLRVRSDSGGSFILMVMADRLGAYVAPSASSSLEKPGELPFVNMQRFLGELGLPVPRILRFDDPAGLMLLEDFGDVTLEERVKVGNASEIADLYGKAVDLLVPLQVQGTARLTPAQTAWHAGFDAQTLRWEFDHYYEWGLCKRFDQEPSPKDAARFSAEFDRLSAEIGAWPRVLCHRDYHSRNLMVKADRSLGMLDFQDALWGSPAYDLASLLRDSYVELPEPLVDSLVARLLSGLAGAGGPVHDPSSFRRLFDLQSIQRNLKAAGRFDFFLHVKGNARYQAAIPGTLAKVRRNLQKYPDLQEIFELLGRYVPDFREGA